ncbi:MAG: 4-hydroxy-3-methylbut-2-enyl diphosphate reductase, partial [Lachnospiraceae bacterium]
MDIKLAKTAGFCFGVKRAVETVYEQLKENKEQQIYTYGP